MDQLEPGSVVEKYRVEERVGRGGLASVYRVRHETLESVHALKVLELTSGTIRGRLLQEGRVQASLLHPNIVTVTDVIDIEGTPGLVMELIDGPDLRRVLKLQQMPVDEALEVFRGIVRGVGHAHEAGVVHRDLKPANVLMAKNPHGTWLPKVADFGLTKLLESEGGEQFTIGDTVMGTPSYMPPEQTRDVRDIDERADIWALGCLLYELLAGQRAFPGTDVVQIFSAVREGEYISLLEASPLVPPHLSVVVDRCLAVDPKKRPHSCEELLSMLDDEHLAPRVSLRGARRSLGAPGPAQTAFVMACSVLAAVALTYAVVKVFAPPPAVEPEAVGQLVGLRPSGLVEVEDPNAPPAACDLTTPGRLGYVFMGKKMVAHKPGTELTLTHLSEVFASVPDGVYPPEVVCGLPEGAVVMLQSDPIRVRGAGVYRAVMTEDVTLP